MAEIEVAAPHRDLARVNYRRESQRSVNRVLEAGAQQNIVRRAEAIILIAAERHLTVDIRSAESRLKVERDDVAAGHDRLIHQEPKIDRALQVPRNRRTARVTGRRRA